MSALAIDTDTGDFLVTNNELTLVDGDEETLQLMYQALWSFQGEWFINLSSGIPYLQQIFVKNPVQAEAILKNAIMNIPGLTALESLSLTVDEETRDATLSLSATSESGQVLTAQLLIPSGSAS